MRCVMEVASGNTGIAAIRGLRNGGSRMNIRAAFVIASLGALAGGCRETSGTVAGKDMAGPPSDLTGVIQDFSMSGMNDLAGIPTFTIHELLANGSNNQKV